MSVPNPELEREEEEALDEINVEDQMDYIEEVQGSYRNKQSLDEFIAEKSASFHASQQGTEDEVEDDEDEEEDEIEKVEVNVPDSKYRIKIGGKFVN